MDNIDEEFLKLTQQLEGMPDPEIAISLLDLTEILEALNGATLYLGRFISKVIRNNGKEVDLPCELLPLLPALGALSEELGDILHDSVCDCGLDLDDDEESD